MLVLISSVPFALDWAAKNVPAILISATGSMEIGNALADILFGQESPAGRLPMTWYSEKAELPDMDDYDIIQGERTYQYYNCLLYTSELLSKIRDLSVIIQDLRI